MSSDRLQHRGTETHRMSGVKSLYNKYRPKGFDDVVGQETIVRTLTNAISDGRIVNAYLFSGPRGTGKTSTARIFAKALLCNDTDRGVPDACGKCQSCLSFDDGTLPDYIEEDAASNRGIDNVRSLIGTLTLSPQISKRKIVLIDEVHHLTSDASTALLKAIEEPPENVIFILVTTDPLKLPETIRSRCQWMRFSLIGQGLVEQRLSYILDNEGDEYDESAVSEIARHAEGGMRDAIAYLDRVCSYASRDRRIDTTIVDECLGIIPHDVVERLAGAIADDDLEACVSFLTKSDIATQDLPSLVKELLDIICTASLKRNGADVDDRGFSDVVNRLASRTPEWLNHAEMVIERNYWKLGNASFVPTHLLNSMCMMIIMPESDPDYAGSALVRDGGVRQAQQDGQGTAVPAEMTPDSSSAIQRILNGMLLVNGKIDSITTKLDDIRSVDNDLMEQSINIVDLLKIIVKSLRQKKK